MDGGNVYDKYATSNPIERRLVGNFLRSLDELVERTGARDGHEVGCGEGELSMRLTRAGVRMRGTDLYEDVIAEARERAAAAGLEIGFEARGVEDLAAPAHAAELVVCCEVIEHLPDPQLALDKLAELASPWLITSVPREPIWRALNLARLKYARDLGNTPGHLNHFSSHSFRAFLERRFEVVELRKPLPWTMALCRVRPSPGEEASP